MQIVSERLGDWMGELDWDMPGAQPWDEPGQRLGQPWNQRGNRQGQGSGSSRGNPGKHKRNWFGCFVFRRLKGLKPHGNNNAEFTEN